MRWIAFSSVVALVGLCGCTTLDDGASDGNTIAADDADTSDVISNDDSDEQNDTGDGDEESSETEPGDEVDVEVEDPPSIDDVVWVTPEAPEVFEYAPCIESEEGCADSPELSDWICPDGWTLVDTWSGVDSQHCVPESPPGMCVNENGDQTPCCMGPQMALPGSADCQPLGQGCPEGDWPLDLPEDADVIYVKTDGNDAVALGALVLKP